jgi:hypothetical protein
MNTLDTMPATPLTDTIQLAHFLREIQRASFKECVNTLMRVKQLNYEEASDAVATVDAMNLAELNKLEQQVAA